MGGIKPLLANCNNLEWRVRLTDPMNLKRSPIVSFASETLGPASVGPTPEKPV